VPDDKAGKEFKSGQDSNILALNSPALSEASTCIIDTTAKDDTNRTENDKLLYQSTTERLIMGKYDTFDRIYKYADNKHMGFEIWLRQAPSEIKSTDMLHSILDSLRYITDLNLLAGQHETKNGKAFLNFFHEYLRLRVDIPTPGVYIFYHLFRDNLPYATEHW